MQRLFLDNRNIMFFEDINKIRLIDIQPAVQREFSKKLLKNESIYYRDGEFIKYKMLI